MNTSAKTNWIKNLIHVITSAHCKIIAKNKLTTWDFQKKSPAIRNKLFSEIKRYS